MAKSDKIARINSIAKRTTASRQGPLWKGPEVDGITFSLLSRFLTCRERFRIQVIDGIKPVETFNHRIEYGNMWHICEEALAKNPDRVNELEGDFWFDLQQYGKSLCKKYPLATDQIDKWYQVCKTQFPIYVKWWHQHPDVLDRQPLMQEEVFAVNYRLPSGRCVKLKGKFDSVDIIGKGKQAGIYLQENKTKGDIDEVQMQRQLTFDLQTMLYLVALREYPMIGYESEGHYASDHPPYPIRGVRYNVVRRPLSGGKGTIVQHKPTKSKPQGESAEEYYGRLRGIIDGSAEDAPGPRFFFMRWKTEVTPTDIGEFCRQCLDPILENLCDWWAYVNPPAKQRIPTNYQTPMNWRHPFGVRNILDEGGSSDLDEYLRTGSMVGLRRMTSSDELFPELTAAA